MTKKDTSSTAERRRIIDVVEQAPSPENEIIDMTGLHPSQLDSKLIDELRAAVNESIEAFCQNAPPLPVDLTFRARPRDDEDDEGEEHVLSYCKKNGRYWIFVDDTPAEKINLRILLSLPKVIPDLYRLSDQKRAEFRRELEGLASSAKAFALSIQSEEAQRERKLAKE